MTLKIKAKPTKHTQLIRERIITSEIRNLVISNVNKLHCARRFVKLFGGNRTLCQPHCLSLFGMFIYRPINAPYARARPVRYYTSLFRHNIAVRTLK